MAGGSKSYPEKVRVCFNKKFRDCIVRDIKCKECYYIQGKMTEYKSPKETK